MGAKASASKLALQRASSLPVIAMASAYLSAQQWLLSAPLELFYLAFPCKVAMGPIRASAKVVGSSMDQEGVASLLYLIA